MNFSIKNREQVSLKSVKFVDFSGNIVLDKYKNINIGTHNTFISDEDNKRVGKIEEYDNNHILYFVKAVKFGNPGELTVNPFESNVLSAHNETDSRSRTFYYLKVNEELFDLYIKFLYTRNQAYLLNINRRIKDGEL